MSWNIARSIAAAVVGLATLTPALLLAQPGGGGPFGGGGVLALVYRDEVQQELQLVDEQRDDVLAIADDARAQIGDEMREIFSQMGDFRNMTDEERQELRDKVQGRIQKLNSDMEGKLKKVLLPHQFDRLKQIDVQTRIQQRGAAALTTGELAEALDLTDEQQEKLERRAEEVEAELQQKIAQLRVEARNKMMDVLTPEQRAKLESMMGDAFALPDRGFGGFQGRGGRGGFFGGRGDRQRDRDN